MDSFSLTSDLSAQWYGATELCDLISLADGVLTRRHLCLFRASCCAPLLDFLDEPLCNQAVVALERLPDQWNYLKHNEAVLRMLNTVPARLRSEVEEADDRRESWIRQDLPQIATYWRQSRDYARAEGDRTASFVDVADRVYGQDIRALLNGHSVISSVCRHIKTNINRFAVIDCFRWASVSISAWDLQDEIDATLQRDPQLARVRACASNADLQADPWEWEYYRRLHCHTFREIVPGPQFDAERVAPWQQPAVLAVTREIDETRDFLQMARLSDELSAVGCEDALVHSHCFRTDETIRGSWLVDLLLGKQ